MENSVLFIVGIVFIVLGVFLVMTKRRNWKIAPDVEVKQINPKKKPKEKQLLEIPQEMINKEIEEPAHNFDIGSAFDKFKSKKSDK